MTIRVLGLGNVLMRDDGFGPYAARVIEAFYDLPRSVQVIDVGTPGLDLTPYLLDADAVIFLDTVSADGKPGEIKTYDGEDILRYPPAPRLGPHDPGLKEALLTVATAGAGPSYVKLIGVIPEWVATGTSLSASVRDAVAPAIGLVLDELDVLGSRPVLRDEPDRPETWWESGDVPPEIRQRLLITA